MATSVDARNPAWLDGVTVSAAEMRSAVTGAVIPYAGIVRGLAIAALPTPDMKVRLPAGLCMIDDGQNGFIPLENPGQVDLDIAPSSATQTRYDAVIGEVVDNGDSTSIRRMRVLTGTPSSGTPTPPALPPSDQPTARTLMIGTVFVQANAETNGKIRTQDVKVTARQILTVPRPTSTDQTTVLSGTDFGTTLTWTDFTSAQWAPLTFTAPASGEVYVTISANVQSNPNSATSTIWASWRGSGGGITSGTASTATDPRGVSGRGGTRCYASKRRHVTGLTPGASVTLTPIWYVSSTSGDTNTRIGEGSLLVEPVA